MKKLFFPFPEKAAVSAFADKWGVPVWIVLHGGILLLLLFSLILAGPVGFNTSLYDILPPANLVLFESNMNEVHAHSLKSVAAADKKLGGRSARQVFILSAAGSFEDAEKGAVLLYQQLSALSVFENLSLYMDDGVIAEFTSYLYDYRFVTAGEETRKLLESGMAGEIAEDALAAAFGAFNFVSLDTIEGDPFMLTGRRLEEFLSSSLLSGGSLSPRNGVLAAKTGETWYVLVRGTLAPPAVSVTNSGSGVRKIYGACSETA
jgi:hypothetical protein